MSVWFTVPGVCDLYLWSTVGGVRLSSNRVSLQVPAKTGGGTSGDMRHEVVGLGCFKRADVF